MVDKLKELAQQPALDCLCMMPFAVGALVLIIRKQIMRLAGSAGDDGQSGKSQRVNLGPYPISVGVPEVDDTIYEQTPPKGETKLGVQLHNLPENATLILPSGGTLDRYGRGSAGSR